MGYTNRMSVALFLPFLLKFWRFRYVGKSKKRILDPRISPLGCCKISNFIFNPMQMRHYFAKQRERSGIWFINTLGTAYRSLRIGEDVLKRPVHSSRTKQPLTEIWYTLGRKRVSPFWKMSRPSRHGGQALFLSYKNDVS